MNELLVIAEHRAGNIREQTLSTLAEAQAVKEKCHNELSAVILGHRILNLAQSLSAYADHVFYIDDEKLRLYNNEVYSAQIVNLVNNLKPRMVLMGQSALSFDIMPALSVKLGLPLLTDCEDLVLQNDHVDGSRHIYEGRVKVQVSSEPSRGCLVTLKSHRAPQKTTALGDLVKLNLRTEDEPHSRTLELIEPSIDGVDIAKARIVVGIGLGIVAPENLRLANDLATALGGVVGCTRPIADKNWLPQTRQIGFSGTTLTAELYVALGLSGSTHHIKGLEKTRTVIAINKDAGAPIFNYARYGVVGDLFEIVPPLIEKLTSVNVEKT